MRMRLKEQVNYNLMLLPGVLFVFLFNTITLVGIAVAFQNYVPGKGWFGSPWVGFAHFELFFGTPDSLQILRNTLVIAIGKIVFTTLTSIIFALLLNEIKGNSLKRIIQTTVYLPHFISWVIYATIIRFMLSGNGMVNRTLMIFGMKEQILFLGKASLFQPVMVITEVFKEFGFGTIIYLAAITAIDPILYEAAVIDGASRFQQARHITIPGITPTIVLLATLSMGNVLNAGFDQIFNLYGPAVYETGDIIDTFVYRVGLISLNFGLGSAIGLMKSVVSIVLITTSYALAARFANYRIF